MKASLLPKTWNIPQIFRDRLGDTVGRQRLMNEDGHLLFILHHVPKSTDNSLREAAFFWMNEKEEWKSAPQGGGKAALKQHLTEYEEVIRALDDQVDQANEARDYFDVLREATPLLRATRHMMEVLQQAREARREDRSLLLLRDQAVELERAIDLVNTDAKSGLEFVTAENAAEQAEISHRATLEARRLNILAAIFFPLVTLFTIFGGDVPSEVIQRPGFWVLLITGVLLGIFVRFSFLTNSFSKKK